MEYVDFTQANPRNTPGAQIGQLAIQPVSFPTIVKPCDVLSNQYVKTPDVVPNSFTLGSTLISGSPIRQLYFPDACGMAEKLGSVGGAAAKEFDYTGSYTITQVREFVKSYALICIAWNFDTSNEKILKNNLSRLFPKLDEDEDKKSMFTAPTVSNQQFNADLLNIKQAFVWTNTTALRLNVPVTAADETVSFTFSFLDAIPYGQLSDYLANAGLPKMHRGLF